MTFGERQSLSLSTNVTITTIPPHHIHATGYTHMICRVGVGRPRLVGQGKARQGKGAGGGGMAWHGPLPDLSALGKKKSDKCTIEIQCRLSSAATQAG